MKKKLLAIALGTSVVFALGACGNKEESKSSKQSASTDSAEQIFQRSCAGCHATDLSGATGPDLRKVGGKYDAQILKRLLKRPWFNVTRTYSR